MTGCLDPVIHQALIRKCRSPRVLINIQPRTPDSSAIGGRDHLLISYEVIGTARRECMADANTGILGQAIRNY
jgi:hypothetical protein